MTYQDKISDYESSLRDIVNSPRLQRELLDDGAAWNTVCSSLDLIGDTDLAISSYQTMRGEKNEGVCYLLVYGVLQTLLLQQDAVKAIARVLGIKVKLPAELVEIRKIRNSAAGHPTEQKENGFRFASFITRNSIQWNMFELHAARSDVFDYKPKIINLESLVEKQAQYLSEVLKNVIDELHIREQKHRDAHKEVLLQDCFPPTMRYYLSKVAQACSAQGNSDLGYSHISLIKNCVVDFREKLEERNEWEGQDSVKFAYEEITYPINEIKNYFCQQVPSKLNEKDAYIFLVFVSKKVDELKAMAVEIDEFYSSPAV